MCIGSKRQLETFSRSEECSASVEGGLERFESGDLLRKEKTSVPFRDHDPSGLFAAYFRVTSSDHAHAWDPARLHLNGKRHREA